MSNVIVSEAELGARARELGERITHDYQGRELDIVCLINGASMFCADLVRHIGVPIRQHFLGFTSYKTSGTSGEVRITLDVADPLEGRHVLLVEGIVITGRTPRYIVDLFRLRRPASLAMCALGRKTRSIAVDLEVQYVGFDLGPEFAVGYGVGAGPERTLPRLVRADAGSGAH